MICIKIPALRLGSYAPFILQVHGSTERSEWHGQPSGFSCLARLKGGRGVVHPGTLFKFFECYDITWVEGDLLTNLAQPSRSSSPVVDALALEFILFLVEPHPPPKTETVLFARQFVESQWKPAEYPAPCSMQRTETLLHTSRYPQPPLVAGLVDHGRQRDTNFAAYTHSGKLQESVNGDKSLSRLGTQRR